MFLQTLSTDPRYFLGVCITVVVSICIHELAHGIVAVWCGDRTPIETGHMTLNPAAHITPVSIICLLLAGIAWGSMPVNPHRMRGRYADALVSAAGPLSNVILALMALATLGLWQRLDHRATADLPQQLANLRYLLGIFGLVNFHLAIFNCIPIPPLDGSRILANLSRSYAGILQLLQSTGTLFVGFIILFSVAGNFTLKLAGNLTLNVLQLIRGL